MIVHILDCVLAVSFNLKTITTQMFLNMYSAVGNLQGLLRLQRRPKKIKIIYVLNKEKYIYIKFLAHVFVFNTIHLIHFLSSMF